MSGPESYSPQYGAGQRSLAYHRQTRPQQDYYDYYSAPEVVAGHGVILKLTAVFSGANYVTVQPVPACLDI